MTKKLTSSATQVLKRLKFDNDTINKVKKYVKYHDYKIEATPRAVRRALNKIGKEYFQEVLELFLALCIRKKWSINR